ncbi:hypothetical protein SUGI_0321770 [Cryptomeria japonica]|uniref:probable WRKY transcription factor 50 n=1 Tax=Cryptomeria japonica TaxID=3369 RepID=UPI002408A9C2|nr:probable WRKY transcription factor 50 [Cryptomeria japonica]GLJ18198.1 hypothetical protein SUGI_0321770 [Cryptomeria japonica]
MGQQGFQFSQEFQPQRSALLHKARYLEEAFEAGKTHLGHNQDMDSFEPSDFLCFNDESDASSVENQEILLKSKASSPLEGRPSSCISSPIVESDQSSVSPPQISQPTPNNQKTKKTKAERSIRYAFKTRSRLDILEDGYKWRKYGKKYVKNNINPRNYYRCSHNNCSVKKRIERDAQDNEVVITTYEGKHNHESPTVVYYIGKPSMIVPQQGSCLEHFPSLLSYTPHGQTDFMFINGT